VERHIYAGDSASVGPVGRVAKADFCAGDSYVGKEVRSEIDTEFTDTYSDLIY